MTTFAVTESRIHRALSVAYDLGPDSPVEKLAAIADRWRPYRS